MEIEEWKKKNFKRRNYAHFDPKVSLVEVWNYISNPNNIRIHSFYPFIHYQLVYKRFKKSEGISEKTREICYSAHIDRYIFQYYGYLINQIYNQKVITYGINDIAIAYRDNLKKNNIHFAKQAIDFIRSCKNCFIIVGDFTDFFDRLDHNYLKIMLKELMDKKSLPPDYYAIYKNITKYSKWDLESLLKLNGLPNTKSGIKQLNQKSKALTLTEFKKYKDSYQKPNIRGYGIPQGSDISAVLSNVYMINFDQKINNYIKKNEGFYMRYCDDFIIILPKKDISIFKQQYINIHNIIQLIPGLKLQAEKTQIFSFDFNQVKSCNNLVSSNMKNGKNILNYLGFSFDGKLVTIRDKTISKYYYRMHRKLRNIKDCQGISKSGKKISNKILYEKYSIRGAFKDKGNFITYVKKAEKIFGKDEAVNKVIINHMNKIGRQLNEIKASRKG